MSSNSIWLSVLAAALLVGGGCGDADSNTVEANTTGEGDSEGDVGDGVEGDGVEGDGDGDEGDGEGDGADGDGDGDGDGGDGDEDEGDDDGDGGGGDQGDDDGGDGDGGGEGDGDGDGEGAGDGDGDEGDGDEGDGDGGGDGDGDGGSLTVEQVCVAQCQQFNECIGVIPGCVNSCLQYHMGLNGECLAAELELDECVLELECPQLLQMLSQKPKPYPCQAEQENSCQAAGCTEDVGTGDEPGECSLTIDCPNDPERTVVCDGAVCTCYVDGDEVGGCDDPLLVCENPSPESLAACCG